MTIMLAGLLLLAAPQTYAIIAGAYQYPVDWSAEKITYPFAAPAGSGRYHLGDDAMSRANTPVYAAASGTVMALENWNSAYNWGGLVLIAHDNADGTQVVTLYGHLDGQRFAVQKGQEIQRGTLLGYIGTPSQNGGWPEHIHFGIRKGGFIDYYQGDPFVYAGYGNATEVTYWENPTPYIANHTKVIEVQRVPSASTDRYATAVGVSLRRYPAAQSAQQVLLGSGANFVDALASTALVRYFDASLLLTKPNELTPATEAEIVRVLPAGKMVTVLGGPQAISDAVVQRLASLGYATQRIDGKNRAATAVGLANLTPAAPARAFVVNDASFADAVSAGSPAARGVWPILLTKAGTLSPETRGYFEQHPGAANVAIVGGESAVSSAVEAELRTIPSIKSIERLGGADRYITNIATNQYLIGSPKTVVLATGNDFADALAGGALAANDGGVLVLSKPAALPEVASGYVSPLRANVSVGYVLGGARAIDPSIDKTLAQLLNQPLAGSPSTASFDSASETSSLGLSSWQAASVSEQDDLRLPVPDGLSRLLTSHQDQLVQAVASVDPASQEVAPPLVVTRLNIPAGQSATAVVADWFGKSVQDIQGRDLGWQNGFEPAYVTFVDKGSEILVIEARGFDAEKVARFVAELNT